MLLLQDAVLPSVVSIIVGEPLHGSWWGDPRSGVIYHVSGALEDHPDVLIAKLVAGKVTYVHRRLWPAIYAVGRARETWQLAGLSAPAQRLLAFTDANVEVQPNDLPPGPREAAPGSARELERRLLVHATEIHTPSGAHAKVLETWPHWAARVGFAAAPSGIAESKHQLEESVKRLANTDVDAPVAPRLVPWPQSPGE